MINTILSDLNYVLLFPVDIQYNSSVNALHGKLLQKFTKYNIFDHFKFNLELLKYYKSLKMNNYSLNMFTSGTIQKDLQIKKIIDPIFENIFSSIEHGYDKRDIQSYNNICKKLNKNKKEILFIDDLEFSIQTAKKAGLNAIHYENNQKLFNAMKSIGVKQD